MKRTSLNAMQETVQQNIAKDRIVRAVQWCAWVAIMGAIVAPLAINAWRTEGPLVACAVLGLCVALCWHVKPAGRSYGARVRDIERGGDELD